MSARAPQGLLDRAHFGDYWPPDFGWTGAADPYSHPDVLVPFEHSGVSFGSMNRNVVGLFTAFLDELVPHIESGLIAGQCGCYNPRSISASGTRSFHSWGIAIDINWGSNPMAVLNAKDPGDLPVKLTHDLARKYGCEWGGDWTSPKDWMHVEVHVSPADAAGFVYEEDPLAGITLDQIAEAVWSRPLSDGTDKRPASAWLKQARNLSDPAVLAKKLAALLPAGQPADAATIEAALRKVFADAGTP